MDASAISNNLYDASTTAQFGTGQSPAEVAMTGGGVTAGAAGGAAGAAAGGATGGASQHLSQVATMHSTVNSLIAGGEGMTSQLMKMAVALLILDMLMGHDSQKSGGDPMQLLTAAMLGQALGGAGATGGGATGGALMSYSSTSEVSVTQATSAASAQQAYAGDSSQPQAAPMVNMIA